MWETGNLVKKTNVYGSSNNANIKKYKEHKNIRPSYVAAAIFKIETNNDTIRNIVMRSDDLKKLVMKKYGLPNEVVDILKSNQNAMKAILKTYTKDDLVDLLKRNYTILFNSYTPTKNIAIKIVEAVQKMVNNNERERRENERRSRMSDREKYDEDPMYWR